MIRMAKRRKSKTRQTSDATHSSSPEKNRFASIYPGMPPNEDSIDGYTLPTDFSNAIAALESELERPVWLLVQNGGVNHADDPWRDSFNMIGNQVGSAFFAARHRELKRNKKIALLIDSQGGMANVAYEIAMLLRKHCGGFDALVPRRAKSAATLLALGADQILMNDHAELGPLDVQIWDPDREDLLSGLDEVQSLERLQAFAIETLDRTMLMLLRRTGKKAKTLMPFVTDFVTKLTEPMFKGIDVVRYTRMSRALKVAEEYGKRLLRKNYGDEAAIIASTLVERFPEHGFPIYPHEARQIGLEIAPLSTPVRQCLEEITEHLPNLTAVGSVV